jgi:hypothetical protein
MTKIILAGGGFSNADMVEELNGTVDGNLTITYEKGENRPKKKAHSKISYQTKEIASFQVLIASSARFLSSVTDGAFL